MREVAKTESPGVYYERDSKEERRMFRKMDMHLLPFVSLLYLLSFLFVPLCYQRTVINANSASMLTGIGQMLVSGVLRSLPRSLKA